MKILFLVNGLESSAAGERVRAFLREWQRTGKPAEVNVSYRPARKWMGLIRFFISGVRTRPDLVYIVDTAYAGVLAALVLKLCIRCRVLTDTGDAAYALARSTGNHASWQLALIHFVEQLALCRTDGVVVRGSYHRALLQQAGVKRVEFVPDGAEPVALSPEVKAAAREVRAHLRMEDSLVVGMVGSMIWSDRHEICYGWDLVEALADLADTSVRVLLVGEGNGRARLEERARKLGVSGRIYFAGRVEARSLLPYLLAMDVAVSTQSNDTVGWVRTTGKLPLYLSAGRYVVATDVGEAHRVLPGVGSLLRYEGVRDNEHPRRLAKLLRELDTNRTLLEPASFGPAVVAREFDYALLARRAWSFCSEVIGSPTCH